MGGWVDGTEGEEERERVGDGRTRNNNIITVRDDCQAIPIKSVQSSRKRSTRTVGAFNSLPVTTSNGRSNTERAPT